MPFQDSKNYIRRVKIPVSSATKVDVLLSDMIHYTASTLYVLAFPFPSIAQ